VAPHAICAAQERVRAGRADDPSRAPAAGRAAHPAGPCDPRPDGRSGDHCAPGAGRVGGALGDDRPPRSRTAATEARPILQVLAVLLEQWRSLGPWIAALEQQIIAWHKSHADSLRLATIPQFGPIVSSALLATVGDAKRFTSGRQFAAWIGVVPKQNSTGGKERLGGITKAGDRYLRQLLVPAPGASSWCQLLVPAPGASSW
jgi:transposase